jgi:AcrR family transcriptional regulator
VYQAIRDDVALAIRPRLRDERLKAKSVEEFISSTFRTFMEFMADDHVNFRTIRHSADTTRVRMDTPEVVAGFEELREDIERAIAEGLFPPIDADFLMASIVGVAFEVGERMVLREKRDPAAAATFATALLLGGIRTLPHADHPAAETGTA